MLYKLGRLLQIVGMVLALQGVVRNIADPQRTGSAQVYTWAIAGVVVFGIGYSIQQSAQPRP
jgi:hypothetical protein